MFKTCFKMLDNKLKMKWIICPIRLNIVSNKDSGRESMSSTREIIPLSKLPRIGIRIRKLKIDVTKPVIGLSMKDSRLYTNCKINKNSQLIQV